MGKKRRWTRPDVIGHPGMEYAHVRVPPKRQTIRIYCKELDWHPNISAGCALARGHFCPPKWSYITHDSWRHVLKSEIFRMGL